MKFLKKINRGAVLFLVVITLVIMYICVLIGKHNKLDNQAAVFMDSFFKAEEDWKSIPEDFRSDSDAYIKTIEKDVKKYFDNESVYEYYIKDAIISQYESNKFLAQEECVYKFFEIDNSKYDGELLEIDLYFSIGKDSDNDYDYYTDEIKITLRESDSGLKIVSFAEYYNNGYGALLG